MKIFISYAREDADHADRLFQALSEIEELSPWLDRQHLLPGTKWKDEILFAIEESRFVALILSTRSVSKTGFVQREFQTAIERLSYHPPGSIFLIPVRIEPCSPRHRELKELQFVDMFPDWEAGLNKIKKAITTQIDRDLDGIFAQLKGCFSRYYPSEKEWIESYGDIVLSYSAPTLVRAIDKANDHYVTELYSLRVLADTAKKADSSLLYDVVVRVHDIVKLCQFDHEMRSFYGILLYCISLLGSNSRAMFLRAAVDFWLEHTSSYCKGGWWSDLAFRDLIKQFVAAESSRYLSGQTMRMEPFFSTADPGRMVIERCLPLISWDIARADFLTFWARKTGNFLDMLDVGNHLLSSFGRRDYGVGSKRKHRPDVSPFLLDKDTAKPQDRLFDKVGNSREELLVADHKEDWHRLGILMRIAEYLQYLEGYPEITDYAKKLNGACIDVLSTKNDRMTCWLSDLSNSDRRRLFWLIERQDFREIQEMAKDHDWDDCKFLLDFVPLGSAYQSKEADRFLPITLPKNSLSLQPQDELTEDVT